MQPRGTSARRRSRLPDSTASSAGICLDELECVVARAVVVEARVETGGRRSPAGTPRSHAAEPPDGLVRFMHSKSPTRGVTASGSRRRIGEWSRARRGRRCASVVVGPGCLPAGETRTAHRRDRPPAALDDPVPAPPGGTWSGGGPWPLDEALEHRRRNLWQEFTRGCVGWTAHANVDVAPTGQEVVRRRVEVPRVRVEPLIAPAKLREFVVAGHRRRPAPCARAPRPPQRAPPRRPPTRLRETRRASSSSPGSSGTSSPRRIDSACRRGSAAVCTTPRSIASRSSRCSSCRWNSRKALRLARSIRRPLRGVNLRRRAAERQDAA